MDDLYKWVNPKTKKHSPMISEDIHKIIKDNQDVSELCSLQFYATPPTHIPVLEGVEAFLDFPLSV